MRERLNDSRPYEIELVVRETENGEPRKVRIVASGHSYAEARAKAIEHLILSLAKDMHIEGNSKCP